jgi:hypothetical protein
MVPGVLSTVIPCLIGKTRARADLDFVAARDFDCETGGERVALSRLKNQLLGGGDIEADGILARINGAGGGLGHGQAGTA